MEFYKLHDLFPKGLNLCNEIIQQIFAKSEFISILKKQTKQKKLDRNKVNAILFSCFGLVGNILEGDIEFFLQVLSSV